MLVPSSFRLSLLGSIAFALASVASAQTWTSVPLPPNALWIAGGTSLNNRLVTTVQRGVRYSDDAINWSEGSVAFPSRGTVDIGRRGSGYWLRYGRSIFLSSDGVSWPLASTVPVEDNNYSPKIAAIGTGAIVTSPVEVPDTPFLTLDSQFWATDDMFRWRQVNAPPQADGENTIGVFSVAAGGDTCLVSYATSGPDFPTGTPRLFVARSVDKGTTWEVSTVEGGDPPIDLAWGNGMFMGISGSGRILTSRDGRHFALSIGFTPQNIQSEIWFGDGMFFVRGNSTDSAILYGTTDGSDWQSLGTFPVENFAQIQSITYASGKYYVFGSTGQGGTEYFIASWETPALPKILSDPTTQQIGLGRAASLSVLVEHPTTVSYQWIKDDLPIAGATASQLGFGAIAASDMGTYRCLVTNSLGTISTASADLSTIATNQLGRLSNLSVNTFSGTGNDILNLGFVLGGAMPKPMTMRGVGPTLADYDVLGFMTDPNLQWIRSGEVAGSNDNWTGDDGRALGAFALPANSLDAVISTEISPGVNSILVEGANEGTGTILTEIYDGDTTDGDTILKNLSARGRINSGASLIVGFVVEGTSDLPIIVRAVGPTLADYGIGDPLSDPTITLYQGQTVIDTNDNWTGNDAQSLGAFGLPPGSLDSVLTVDLAPGVYTAHVTSNDNSEDGIVLLEIYDAR